MKNALILLGVFAPLCITAQSRVDAVFTHLANATTGSSYTGGPATGAATTGMGAGTYTYDFGTDAAATNNIQYLDSFTSIGLNYHYQAATEVVYFRRVNNASTTGLRKSLWFEQPSATTVSTGGAAAMIPTYDDSLERLFSEQIFNIGIDNNFQNATTTNNANIERVDVIFPGGVSATDVTKAGFVVFDRGNSGSHDPFYIAAVKTLDGSGNPSAYYNAVSVTSTEYGSNIGGAVNFLVLRENPGDGHLLLMNNTANQNRDGVFLRFTDLGVTNNTTIYGYSLFGTDVTVSPAANMVNYANATNFPTSSDYSNGGLDQLAVTGLWVTKASYVVLADRVSDFGAVLTSGGGVQLSWNLGLTDDLQEVVLERSANGTDFAPLIDLADPSGGPQNAIDAHPLPGESFYRLKLVNTSGAVVTYSAVCGVTVGGAAGLMLGLYPDPVRGRQVELTTQGLKQEPYTIRIMDLSGKPVLERVLTGSPVLSLPIALPPGLPAGMYFLQLVDNSGAAVAVKSFVVD
jgi:hypothetical protein